MSVGCPREWRRPGHSRNVPTVSHCTGYRFAALARTSEVVMPGIDAEPDEPLPEGVLEVIALPGEIARLSGLRAM
ncbi:hypothetical protein AB0L75_23710 [Streptomyces sp. NPDC052101]|uniref:hypothetical protein n=1 Tax=Streptomyces sp. NPDC052101 TaxID=3155763 RepID=UPI0034352E75